MEQIWNTYEEMKELIYAADIDTYELLYMNRRLRELYGVTSGEQIKGKKCYEFLQNCAEPCAMCTNCKLLNGKAYEWEYYNQHVKCLFQLRDQMILQDGRRIRVEVANSVADMDANHRYQGMDETEILVSECLRMSLEMTDPDQGIKQLIEYLGNALLGDRVYIFELSDANEWNNTYEWCAYNVTSEIDSLQNVPYNTTEKIWNKEFENNRFIVIKDLEEIRESDQEIYNYLSPQNIHSVIVGPLYREDKLCGFYGIDNPPREKIEEVAAMLKTIGHVIDTMLEKRDLMEKLQILEREHYDQLTGGFTRKGFIHEVERIFKESSEDQKYAIVAVDINNFKSINEIFGLKGGDILLRKLYQVLQSDVQHIMAIGRLEADWFVCLVKDDGLNLDQVEDSLQMEWAYEGRNVHTELTCGIVFVTDRSIPASHWMEWAVMAKQNAKDRKIRKFSIFDEHMRQEYVSQAEILSSFHRGIQNEEFQVYYQPIIEMTTNEIVSAEALVRWKHGKLGHIVPSRFIPVFEKNGMITELDHYVLKKVYQFLDKVEEKQMPVFTVAINLSWQDFYDQKMMDDIINLASRSTRKSRRVNYEVTETSLSALEQNCAYLLGQFQKCGAKILLDDFGSGVSSLGMISNYPFDIVKIDRSFIRQIEESQKMRSIIKSIIVMCHEIGLRVLAEGVETREQLDFLREVKCDYVQGFYYAKPMPEEEFCQYVSDYSNKVYDEDNVKLAVTKMGQPLLNDGFFKSIVDKMDGFVAVINPKDYSLIYLNEKALSLSQNQGEPYQGKKCYQYMSNFDRPCGHCMMKNLSYDEEHPIAIGNGDVFMTVTASMREVNGKQIFMEVEDHVYDATSVQSSYIKQVKSILEAFPNILGISHVDLTDNEWISSGGNSDAAQSIQYAENVDSLIRRIAAFIPDSKTQEVFLETFNRQSMMQAYAQNKFQLSMDMMTYINATQIVWTRITAYLLFNNTTEHIECILYSVDISDEKEYPAGKELSEENVYALYEKADHDRRIDYLTGLWNRLDLNDRFIQFEEGDASVGSVFMLDIDDFKEINDHYGHIVGDQCLKEFGARVGDYGMKHGIWFFRYGGEEFLGIEVGSEKSSEQIAEDILQLVREIEVVSEDGENVAFTVSIGYTRRKAGLKEMVGHADRAMYIAKRKEKNCAVEYNEVE